MQLDRFTQKAQEALLECLGLEDGLLGLLGESVELHDRDSLAWVGLVERCKEGSSGCSRLLGEIGREDDLRLDEEIAVAAPPESRHPLAAQAEGPAGLGPGRDRQEHSALEGLDRDLRAKERLLERH